MSERPKVKVSITIEQSEGDVLTLACEADAVPDMAEAILCDLIPVARRALHVPEDDVWTFGERA